MVIAAGVHIFELVALVIVPLGLDLIRSQTPALLAWIPARIAIRLQPIGAILAAASFALPAGHAAGALASVWLTVSVLLGLAAAGSVLRGPRPRSPEDVCTLAALLYLPAGGMGLLLTRAGAEPMGFVEPIVLLTAVHYHFAAFAGPLLAGQIGRLVRGRGSPQWRLPYIVAASGAVVGPGLLGAGWATFSPALKIVAALVLAASHAGLAVMAGVAAPSLRPAPARWLLWVSCGSVLVGMVLASVYAVGEFLEIPAIGIPRMASTHGLANGLGFTFCGLLAWWLAADRREALERRSR